MKNNNRDIQVVFLGDTYVGKTSILERIKSGAYHEDSKSYCSEPFIKQKKYEKKNITISLKYIDTFGQEFSQYNIPVEIMRDSHIFILVFSDITTFTLLNRRWNELYKHQLIDDNREIILIGNKSDTYGKIDKREEIIKQGQIFAEEIDAHFLTCSAKYNDNFDNIERYIETEAKRVIDKEDIKKDEDKKIIILKKEEKNSKFNDKKCI